MLRRFSLDPLTMLAVAVAVFHAATSAGYGHFRDELYYLACGDHLGWGYVDHPPLIGLIAAAVKATLGTSTFAIRLLPALAAGATVWLTGAMARDLGGGRLATILAGVAAALLPTYLSLFSILSMNAFDLLIWAASFWLLVRLLSPGGASIRAWIALGVVLGVGLENKISVLFLGFGVAIGLVATRRWDVVRSRGPWLAAAIAVALFLPHVLWQAANGWPTQEFIENARAHKMVEMSPGAFLLEQLKSGAATAPLWLAGLGALLFAARLRPWRALGVAYLAVLLLLIATHGKPYYLAPAYTVLLAAGAVAAERVRGLAVAALVLVVVGGAAAAPLAKPLLPVDTYVRYQAALGLEPGTDERQALGRLPQFFADMHGWRELARSVGVVYRALPAADQARACVFGENYGEASAIAVFGDEERLPPVISGHNSYFLWGPGRCTADVLIVIGADRDDLVRSFEEVELGATHRCQDCMPYENDLPIWVVRRPRLPVDAMWSHAKGYI